jgi:uncharacterized protein with HEPN domain
MYDRELVNDLIEQVEEAIRRIERRFEGIASATDFIANDEGLDRLDGIAMMLIAIGENVKKIDKFTNGDLFAQYPEIQWPGVKGTRDILAHDYFGIDHEEIYAICRSDLGPLKSVLRKIRDER